VPIGSASPPDRSLGDYFTLAADPQGRLHVAFVRATGQPGPVLHARQEAGPRLR